MVVQDSISIKSVKADTGKRKIQTINFSVIGNLYRSMSGRLGRAKAGELSILTARLLEWNLNVRTDLMRGDKAIMLFEKNKQGLSIIALKYFSQKKNRTFNYYRFKSKTSAFPKYFNESGHRTDYVLENSPLKDYDQIIAFLGDGRNHNGIDFKAPIGTPIYAPAVGKITKINWNRRYNGNCIELKDSKGSKIQFLHLEKVASNIKRGKYIKTGTLIGYVGNTGRSYGPHLHYQINKGKRVLDPTKYHKRIFKKLDRYEMESFKNHKLALESSMAPELTKSNSQATLSE